MTDSTTPVVPTPHLQMWVIYKHPSDYPGKFVVRCWMLKGERIVAEVRPWCVVETLEDARNNIPIGRINIGRRIPDDPVIVEVWL